MNKFDYFKINRSKKIRYLKYDQENATYIVFLHGFMSDLTGKKPKTFYNFARKNNLGFLALEYSGHGKSLGKFCLLYTSPSPRDISGSRMPSSA